MNSIFIVQHERPKDEDNEDVKLIGAFSTRELAECAIVKLQNEKGFGV